MLHKAIIEYVDTDSYQFKVRIPILDKKYDALGSTSNSNLYDATVCIFPGGNPEFALGDVVYVDFEDNDLGKPVIMGVLYRQGSNSSTSINCESLNVNVSATLPENISIGNITKERLSELYSL